MTGTPVDRVVIALSYALKAKATSSMSKGQQTEWLRINAQSITHLPEDLIQQGVKHAVNTCEHVGQIISTIITFTSSEYAKRVEDGGEGKLTGKERVEALRKTIPHWNEALWKERPELKTFAEWHVSDDGEVFIYDLSDLERRDRGYSPSRAAIEREEGRAMMAAWAESQINHHRSTRS